MSCGEYRVGLVSEDLMLSFITKLMHCDGVNAFEVIMNSKEINVKVSPSCSEDFEDMLEENDMVYDYWC